MYEERNLCIGKPLNGVGKKMPKATIMVVVSTRSNDPKVPYLKHICHLDFRQQSLKRHKLSLHQTVRTIVCFFVFCFFFNSLRSWLIFDILLLLCYDIFTRQLFRTLPSILEICILYRL